MSENTSIENHLEIYKQLKIKGFSTNNFRLYIKDAGVNQSNKNKGLGVFTNKPIPKGQVIEYSPAIVMDWKGKYVHDQGIKQYAYWHGCSCEECKKHGATGMIPLGYGSIINTADSETDRNCGWITRPQEKVIIFFAEKDISSNEEILTWWGQGYYDGWCK